MPRLRSVRMMRTAISPRLAMRTFVMVVMRSHPEDAVAGVVIGARETTSRARPRTSRVCAGSITPSSHRRAVE
jgi:hypothetical protein